MAEVLTPTRSIPGFEITKPRGIEWINLLIYGDSGVGKTTLAASAAAVEEMSPVLFLDVEGGTLSIRNRFPDVDVIRIRSFNEFNDIYASLAADMQWKTIILDSLTEIQRFGMYEVLRRAVEKAEEDGDERDPLQPQIQDWGKNLEQTRSLVRAFRDLPCHTIMTALSREDRKPNGEVKVAKPSLTGKAADEIAGFMDIVLFMYLKELDGDDGEKAVHRLALSMGTDKIVAKDRSDNLPAVLMAPSMEEIHQIATTRTEEVPQ